MTETLLLVKRRNSLGELVANIQYHPTELCQTPPLIDSLGTLRGKTEVVSLLTVKLKLNRNKALSVHIRLSHMVVSMSIYSLYGTATSLTTSQMSPASGVAYF